MRKKILFPVIVLLLPVWFTSCHSKQEAPDGNEADATEQEMVLSVDQLRQSSMEIGTISEQPFEKVVTVNGYLRVPPQAVASISALIPGQLTFAPLSIGSYVKKGELLFKIKGLEIIQLQQDYLDARARLEALRLDYERQKDLAAEKVNSEKVLKAAESEYLAMQANYNGLKAKLKLLGIAQPDAVNEISPEIQVVAPINGYVTSMNGMTGKYVDPMEMVVELIDPSELRLELSVYGQDAMKLEKGMEVVFYNPDQKEIIHKASLSMVGKTLDPKTNTVLCLASLDEKEANNFVNGMFVEATIILSSRVAHAVPVEAVIKADDNYYIMELRSRDTSAIHLAKVSVVPGEEYLGYREIGLDGHPDSIVVKGVYNLMLD